MSYFNNIPLILIFIFLVTGLPYNNFAQSHVAEFFPIAPQTLSNTMVRCFHRDSQGFLWLGTTDGLFRYDGTHLKGYEHDPGNPNSICHNNINAIIEDDFHNLWIGTAQGVSHFQREKESFQHLDSMPGLETYLNNRYITALALDEDGKLWIGTHGGGVNVYNPEIKEFFYLDEFANTLDAPGDSYINTVMGDKNLMWFGTKGGLKVYNTSDLSLHKVEVVDTPLPRTQVTQVAKNREGDIFVSTLPGEVFRLVPRNGYYLHKGLVSEKSSRQLEFENIITISFDQAGSLWLGGEHSGLNHIELPSGKLKNFDSDNRLLDKLPTKSIRSVYVDEEGFTWVGTYDKGAFLLKSNFANFEAFGGKANPGSISDENKVRGFAEDHAGQIWLAYDGKGLLQLNPESGKLEKDEKLNLQLNAVHLTSIICDRENNLWIGTDNKGVIRVDLESLEIDEFPLESKGFGNNNVSVLYEDKRGVVWAGTLGSGLFYFDNNSLDFRVLAEESKIDYITSNAYVSSLAESSDGVFWIGTMYGLYALRPSVDGGYDYNLFLKDDFSGSISSNSIQSLMVDDGQNLWVGTTDNGLNLKRRNSTKFEHYNQAHGLASNVVRSIEKDSKGGVWISGNRGLSKFNVKQKTFSNYTTLDGLTSNNHFQNASLRTSEGKIYFGNNDGFSAFYPDSIVKNIRSPKLYLTDLNINNESVSIGTEDSPLTQSLAFTQEIELSYQQRSFQIDFVAIEFGSSNRLRYCYRLEGFDEDWICDAQLPNATYTNLDPGKYTFEVKAANHAGVWNEEPTRLNITILPLVWKTWWAFLGYSFILSLMAYFFLKFRLDREKMRNQLELEKVAREKEHKLNESKTQFFTNISHEFRTPLSLVLLPLEDLKNKSNLGKGVVTKISMAYRNADKMLRLVNELLEFNKLESGHLKLKLGKGEIVGFLRETCAGFFDLAERNNLSFSIKAEEKVIYGEFDSSILEKILINLLSNAFKFTNEGGRIKVVARSQSIIDNSGQVRRKLLLTVIDDGIGISNEEIPKIFDKFYQAKSAKFAPNPGTGIGLSFTKSLVELHGGTIEVKSFPHDETSFKLSIPIDGHQAESWYMMPFNHQEGVVPTEESEMEDKDDCKPNQNITKAKLLLIEDNDELKAYLVRELGKKYEVLAARDGREGIKLAEQHLPDLVISDILMPGISGLTLCKLLKSNLKTCHIPVVLLTAKSSIDEQVQGVENGADLYLTKPFNIQFLKANIHQMISSRHKLFSSYSQNPYLTSPKMAEKELDQEFLANAIAFVEENLQDNQVGVDAIAAHFSFSRSQAYRKIKALTGKSVVEFIRSVRLKKALQLMDTQKYTLSEIAYEVGFSSASYFTRSFKDHYGKSPSTYLKR